MMAGLTRRKLLNPKAALVGLRTGINEDEEFWEDVFILIHMRERDRYVRARAHAGAHAHARV